MTNNVLQKYNAAKDQLREHLVPYLESQGRHMVGGKLFSCINPEHDDSSPSCGIVPESHGRYFHCFGCGCTGDIFTAAYLLEGRQLSGAGFIHDNLKYLADQYGVEIPIEEPNPDETYEIDTYRAYRDASQIILFSKFSDRVEAKLADYGWSREIRLGLGVGSVASYEDFVTRMKKQHGWSDVFLKEIDLHRKGMFNENNLIFTVKDENGNPVGFACRNLLYEEQRKEYDALRAGIVATTPEDSDERKKAITDLKHPTKYINSMEHSGEETAIRNRIYQKSKRLFGLHRARKYTPPLYVFEGYSDCVTAVNAGLQNSCAIGSTSFTRDHLELILGLGIKHIIFVLDADDAGEAGTDRFVKLLEECVGGHIGLRVEIVAMPAGTDDPDNYIRKMGGLKSFRALDKIDIFGWSLHKAVKNGEDRTTLAERMVSLIVNEQSNFVRLRKAEQLAKATGLSQDVVWREVTRLVDSELSQINEEKTLIANQAAKQLQMNPLSADTILANTLEKIEQVQARKQGYSVANTMRYIEEIQEIQEQDTNTVELATGWALFDKWVGGIPKSECFVTIPGKMNQGKAIKMSSKLKTLDDWILMKDIKVGDSLASIDGEPSVVTGVFPQGMKKAYKITFADGRETTCCDEHLWQVQFCQQYAEGYGSDIHNGWKVLNTEAIRTFCLNGNRKSRHKEVFIPLVDGRFGHNNKLSINPWLLGVLLGDGSITSGTPTFTSADLEIINKVEEIIKNWDLKLSKGNRYSWRISNPQNVGKSNPLMDELRTLGLQGKDCFTKFIPENYLLSNRENRIALLQGLMDTDGTIGKTKEVSFTSVSHDLAIGVQELVRSLGGLASISEKKKTFTYKGEKRIGALAYQVNIRITNKKDLFTLTRKRNRAGDSNRRPLLLIKKIEYAGEYEMQCITVSHPSKLFIIDDFIVTHNSSLLANLAWRLIEKNPGDCMVLYHTIDDSLPIFLPRVWGSKFQEEGFNFDVSGDGGHKTGWYSNDFKKAGYALEKYPEFEEIYQKAMAWTSEVIEHEYFIPEDISTLAPSLPALENRIKALRQKFPERRLVVIGDNFHLYDFPGFQDGESKTRHMSMFVKGLANKYHATIIMTMELPKTSLQPGVRPRVRNIKGTGGISYDSSLNIGVYNDIKDFGESAKLVESVMGAFDPSTGLNPYRRPVLELVFDKSKVNSFDGVIYFDFEPRSGRMDECSPEKQIEWRQIANDYKKAVAEIAQNGPVKSDPF